MPNIPSVDKTSNHWSDHLSHLTMQFLTGIGQNILPSGYWGDATKTVSTTSDGIIIKNLPAEKRLYLTFDDGPNPETTEALLEILAEENTIANFFLIGKNIAAYPELARKITARGHVVGNHSYSHSFMPGQLTKTIESEIRNTNALLQDLNGKPPKLFRPPYGMIDFRGASCLSDLGMTIVYWGLVPVDWQSIGAERVVARVCKKLDNGKVIVLHEGSKIAKQTLTATKEIIRQAKAQGYIFAALPEE